MATYIILLNETQSLTNSTICRFFENGKTTYTNITNSVYTSILSPYNF